MADQIIITHDANHIIVASNLQQLPVITEASTSASYAATASLLLGSVASALTATSASYATTASYALNGGGGGTSDYTALTNVPVGIVSSSGQVSFSGITNKPTGLVSSSAQVSFTGITNVPVGLVSSSAQVVSVASSSLAVTSSYARTAPYTGLTNVPVGLVSSSAQVAYTGITGVPTGLVSSSAQITSVATSSLATTASYATVAQNVLGTISSASYATVAQNVLGTITSASYATVAQNVLGSITSASYAASASNLVEGATLVNPIVSQSLTLSGSVQNYRKSLGNVSASVTLDLREAAVFALTLIGDVTLSYSNSRAGASYFLELKQDGTGNRRVQFPAGTVYPVGYQTSGSLSTSETDVYSIYYDGTSYFTSNFRVVPSSTASLALSAPWSGITSIPTGLVSSSGQVSYTGLTNVPTGILSASAQINALSGVTASYATVAQSVLGSITSASFASDAYAVWGNVSGKPTGLLSSSAQLNLLSGVSASFASRSLSASYAGTDWNAVNNKPVGLVSSSAQLTGPVGIVSSSAQINAFTDVTASMAMTASRLLDRRSTVSMLSMTSGSVASGTVNLGNEFVLLAVSSSHNARLRLYNADANRVADVSRVRGIYPSGSAGVITEIIFSGSVRSVALTPAAFGASGETVITGSYPFVVNSDEPVTSPVTMSFTYKLL